MMWTISKINSGNSELCTIQSTDAKALNILND